jgi:hypothetical protein
MARFLVTFTNLLGEHKAEIVDSDTLSAGPDPLRETLFKGVDIQNLPEYATIGQLIGTGERQFRVCGAGSVHDDEARDLVCRDGRPVQAMMHSTRSVGRRDAVLD